jgi:hypothetical protein
MSRYGWGLIVVAAFGMLAVPVAARAGVCKALIAKHYETHESLCAKLKHKHKVAGPHPILQHLHHGGKGGQSCPNCP